MKRFLAIAAIIFLCAACAAFPANAQNAPSNAVWVGVSVNVTNGTVSPPILEQRIAEGGGGAVDTNAIIAVASNYFVWKWPAWYKVVGGLNADYPTNYNSAGGYFNHPYTGDYLQSSNKNLTVGAVGPYNAIQRTPKLMLRGTAGVEIRGLELSLIATNASSGVTLANLADGVFSVTWNGVEKNGWDEIVESALTNGTARSVAITPLDYDEWEESSLASKAGVFAATGSVSVLVMRAPGGNVVNIHDGGEIDLGEDGSFVFVPGSLEATNDVKAASFTIGTNTITEWPSGGGGLSGSRVVATNSSVAADDYLVWLDTREFSASDSVTLTLPDMGGDSQTIVVRRLGNTGDATIARGTNTWALAYDGDGVTVDWLKAATNWFWRAF